MRTILTFIFGCFISFNAYAISDTTENRITEYERFKSTQPNNDKETNEVIRQTLKSSMQNMFGQDINSSGVEFKKFVDFVIENNTTLLDDKALNEKINKEVYTTIFTADEMHAIAIFFASPAGKSYQKNAIPMMLMSMKKAKQYIADNGGKPSILEIIQSYISSHPKLLEEMYLNRK